MSLLLPDSINRQYHRLREHATREKGAYIAGVEELPPSPDGRQYRYEVAVKLNDSVTEPIDESEVRKIADTILEAVEDIDSPEWGGRGRTVDTSLLADCRGRFGSVRDGSLGRRRV